MKLQCLGPNVFAEVYRFYCITIYHVYYQNPIVSPEKGDKLADTIECQLRFQLPMRSRSFLLRMITVKIKLEQLDHPFFSPRTLFESFLLMQRSHGRALSDLVAFTAGRLQFSCCSCYIVFPVLRPTPSEITFKMPREDNPICSAVIDHSV